MTISAVTLPVEYPGNGVATSFAYTWKVTSKTHLSVIEVAADGTRTTAVEGTDYTVSNVGSSNGGNVVFSTAPALGVTVVIDSVVPYDQTADLRNQGDSYPERIENALDRNVRQIQQINRDAARSLRIATGEENYDAGGVRIVDLADGVEESDAATVGQLDETFQTVMSGVAGSDVLVVSGTGDGVTVNLSFPGITSTVSGSYLLVVGGVLQRPGTDFTVDVPNERLVCATAPGNTVPWFAISIGYQRAINILSGGSIDTGSLADDAVTFAKMQNIATMTLIGRSTAGTGSPESIAMTTVGLALLQAANADAQLTALGAGAGGKQVIAAASVAAVAALLESVPVLLQESNVTASASMDFASIFSANSSYPFFKIALEDLNCSGGSVATELWLRFSEDGSTFITSGTAYEWFYTEQKPSGASPTYANDSSDSEIVIENVASVTGRVSGSIFIVAANHTNAACTATFDMMTCNTNNADRTIGVGCRKATNAITGFQLRLNTGSFTATGKIRVYGSKVPF